MKENKTMSLRELFAFREYGPVYFFLFILCAGGFTYLLSMLIFSDIYFSAILLYITVLLSGLTVLSIYLILRLSWTFLSLSEKAEHRRVSRITSLLGSTFPLVPILDRFLGSGPSLQRFLLDIASMEGYTSAFPLIGYELGGLNLWMFLLSTGVGLASVLPASRKEGVPIVRGFISLALSAPLTFLFMNVLFSQFRYLPLSSTIQDHSYPFDLVDPVGLAAHQHLHLVFLILLGECILLAISVLYVVDREKFVSLVKNIKLFRTLHFSLLVVIGVLISREIASSHSLDPTYILHIPFIILAMLTMALTWQFTAIINDIYDREIDRLVHPERPLITGALGPSTYSEIAMLCGLTSLFLSLLLGPLIFVLDLTFIMAALLYSVPPVRLKDRPFGTVCVGYASAVSFLVGVYSPVYWREGVFFGSEVFRRSIPFFPEILSISLLIFVVLSISPLINALQDYQGDKKSGVKNVYTIYGRSKGKKIVSILTFFLFLAPLMLINSGVDIVVILPSAITASVVFYRSEEHRFLFPLYLGILAFTLMRFMSML